MSTALVANGARRPKPVPHKAPTPPDCPCSWELVTPALAADYLEANFDRNRNQRRRWVEILSRAMKSGEFLFTHQGIAFDEDGFLIDGQHRLAAIVDSGESHWLLVVRNIPRSHVVGIDIQARRAAHDQIRVIHSDMDPNQNDVAVARMMWSGIRQGTDWGDQLLGCRLMAFMEEHWDAVCFVRSGSRRRRARAAPMRAVVARAYYHADHARLLHFLDVLDSGEANGPGDFAAIRLRERVAREAVLTRGGRDSRESLYRLTCSAVVAFLQFRPITKLYEASEDPFPLPK
jgi:hypothetical protein